jgi:hypothetical protein
MSWWRRAPICHGTTADGAACTERVAHPGERCPTCLEALATSPDRQTRRKLAGQTELAPELIDALASDEDRRIRLAIAGRSDCPLVTLQRLEHDDDAAIRAVAGSGLSAALAPRALVAGQGGGLFTEAELEALADAPGETVALPDESESGIDTQLPAGDTNELLRRLDAMSRRLAVLEARLESARLPPATRRTGRAGGTRRTAPSEDVAFQPHLPGLWEPPVPHGPDAGGRRRRLHSRRR